MGDGEPVEAWAFEAFSFEDGPHSVICEHPPRLC